MKRAVLTILLILAGVNLLAWGLSGGQIAIDLRTGLAALCLNGYFFLFLLLGYPPLQKALGDWFGRSAGRTLAAVPVLWIPYSIETFVSPGALLPMALGIFIFIGIPEELLFRGIIQNLLEKAIGRPALALGVASLIFGAAHLNNGPSPDWRYLLLATLAGLVYGRAYASTRNLMAPALLHTLVDVAWRGFFR